MYVSLAFAYLLVVPPAPVLSDALNSAGMATPGQAVQVDCESPDGPATFYILGDMPMPTVTLSAKSCAMPPGYVRRLW